MSEADQFLGHALDDATTATAARQAYAQAIAMDPLASPTDLFQLMSMRDTRLREIAEGVVRRPRAKDRAESERLRWRNACAYGQSDAEELEGWLDSLSFEDARSSYPYRQLLAAYPDWLEWRQSADAPPRSVRIIEQWIRYGSDEDARTAYHADAALNEPTERSLRIRPRLYSLVAPLLFGEFGAPEPRGVPLVRGEAAIPRPTIQTQEAPVTTSDAERRGKRSKGGIVLWILFFAWVLATSIWFFSDDDERGEAEPEVPAVDEAPR